MKTIAFAVFLLLQVIGGHAGQLDVIEQNNISADILEFAKPKLEAATNGALLLVDKALDRVAKEVQAKFGGNWYCYQAHEGHKRSAQIQESDMFAVLKGDLIFIYLRKDKIQPPPTPDTYIDEARKQVNNLKITFARISPEGQTAAIDIARETILTGLSLKEMAGYCRDQAKLRIRSGFQCSVQVPPFGHSAFFLTEAIVFEIGPIVVSLFRL